MVDVKKRYARPTLRVLGTREEAEICQAADPLRQAMDDLADEAATIARGQGRRRPPGS